jgi:hypothetical protein
MKVRSFNWKVIVSVAACSVLAGPLAADDADFNARCTAPGVIKCVGFDGAADIQHNSTLYPAAGGAFRGTIDTGIKASGNGSLRFEIPAGSGANASGYWSAYMGQQFGANTTFYVQFRQRFSQAMLDTRFVTGSGSTTYWKQIILHKAGSSCASIELTTGNIQNRGFPQMYSQCGAQPLDTNLPGGDYGLQQGDYDCRYQNPSDCSFYQANEWMTFYYEIHLGSWGTPSSYIKAYVAYEGGPMLQFIDLPNTRLNYNNSPSDTYDTVDLLTYMTGKSGSQSHPTAYAWYDELIVSTQPIAGPNGEVVSNDPPPPPPVTPPADTVAPNPPYSLAFQ